MTRARARVGEANAIAFPRALAALAPSRKGLLTFEANPGQRSGYLDHLTTTTSTIV